MSENTDRNGTSEQPRPEEGGKSAAQRFADWLEQGPKLAKAAGCHVGIRVTSLASHHPTSQEREPSA